MSPIDPVYNELAVKLGSKEPRDLEYMPRILEKLMNLDQAKIVLALPDSNRKASSGNLEVSEEFAKQLNLDKKVVDDYIQELFEKGVVFPTSKGPQFARNAVQLHDAALVTDKFDKSLGDEYFDLWGAWTGKKEKPTLADCPSEKTAYMRIVPKWKAIKDIPETLPFEDMREILKQQELIVLANCTCKKGYRNRTCGTPDGVCMVVGRSAEFNLSRGVGRKITSDEALELLGKFDKYPVVNCVVNTRGVNALICNCHWCCCGSLGDNTAKSRFITEVDPAACRACKTCITRCNFGAAQMKYYPEFGEERVYVDPEICRGCGTCVVSCPAGARTMKIVRPPEHVPELHRGAYD